MSWQVYIIEADDGSLYTGVTTDVQRRFAEHCRGKRGARYFSGRQPLQVVYTEAADNRSAACKREAAIKKLSRLDKMRLFNHPISEEPR
jgi:putative endonuclease